MSLTNMLISLELLIMELEDLKYVKSGAARFFGKIYLLPYLGRKHPNWPNVEVFSNISKQIVVIFCRK